MLWSYCCWKKMRTPPEPVLEHQILCAQQPLQKTSLLQTSFPDCQTLPDKRDSWWKSDEIWITMKETMLFTVNSVVLPSVRNGYWHSKQPAQRKRRFLMRLTRCCLRRLWCLRAWWQPAAAGCTKEEGKQKSISSPSFVRRCFSVSGFTHTSSASSSCLALTKHSHASTSETSLRPSHQSLDRLRTALTFWGRSFLTWNLKRLRK